MTTLSNVEKLEIEVNRLQKEEGVVAIRLLRAAPRASQDAVAKGVLDLMTAATVIDHEMF